MKINEIDIRAFEARLVSRTLESSETNVDMEWPNKSLHFYMDDNAYYKFKKLKLDVEFKGDFRSTNLNKSKLLSQLAVCVITDIGLNPNTLTGGVISHSIAEINGLYHRVNYELLVIEEMIETTVTGSSVNNPGTGITPAKIEITPNQSGTHTLYINQGGKNEIKIVLNNMTAGKTREISVTGGIVEAGMNKFSDTILFSYPKLNPGLNNISINPSAIVKTTFKPRVI